MTANAEPRPEAMRVSTIELFFDLVFVFTITQVTRLVEDVTSIDELGHAFLVLTLIWWMFSAYAWLTNSCRPGPFMRVVMIAAMGGFLVMALAVPEVFGKSALAFALAYLVVVLLHAVAFIVVGGRAALRGLLEVGPFNLAAAALVLIAALVDPRWNWILMLSAVSLFVIATVLGRERRFTLRPDHFAERHGAVVLIALGESIVAIGTGASSLTLDAHTISAVLLSLALIATLWWTYFDRDDERAVHAMQTMSERERAHVGVVGYWYSHLIMLAGIVLLAPALREIVAEGEHAALWSGWVLASGTSCYLAGDVLFRRVLHIRPLVFRAVAAVLAIPIGALGGAPEPAALALLLVATLIAEYIAGRRAASAAS